MTEGTHLEYSPSTESIRWGHRASWTAEGADIREKQLLPMFAEVGGGTKNQLNSDGNPQACRKLQPIARYDSTFRNDDHRPFSFT